MKLILHEFGLFGIILGMMHLGVPAPASANPNDIVLRGVGRPINPTSLTDPAVLRYRSLGNELAVAMAPRVLAPAETLGMNGFEFSLVTTHVPINSDADYWQGQPGSPVFEGVTHHQKIPKSFWVPTVHLRKGLPLSTELGITGSYLAFSKMFMLGADFKIAWHESFFRYAPAFATRASFARLFGASDLDIITGEIDGIVSLPFGIGGMAQVTPYAGYGQLFVHINSQIIDETPEMTSSLTDQTGGTNGSLYTFPTIAWSNNSHGRIFGGARLVTAFVELLFEFNYVLVDPTNMMSFSIKVGFDV